jgi:cytochrome P450
MLTEQAQPIKTTTIGSEKETPPSACPFHRLLGLSSAARGVEDEDVTIQVHTSPESTGQPPIGQYLLNRFHDFGVMIAEGISGLTGFDLMQVQGQRLIPLVPYDSNLLNIAQELRHSPFAALREVIAKNGPDSQFVLPTGHRVLFTTDPEITRHILLETDSKSHSYTKGNLLVRASEPVFGADNMVVASGDAWKSRRSAVARDFGKSRFEERDIIQAIDRGVLDSVHDLKKRVHVAGGELVVDLQKELAVTAMRVFLTTFFHVDAIPTARLESLRDALVILLDAFPAEGLNILPVSLLEMDQMIPPLSNLAEANQVVEDFVGDLIAASRARDGEERDVLDTLVNARDADSGQPISDEALREELKALIVAGYENTGRSLALCFKELSENTTEYQRIQQEVDLNQDKELLKTSELVETFPAIYQNECETLRMYPTVYGLTRHATKANVIETASGPVHIREGTTIVMSPFFMQRREELFGLEKTGFQADRFAPMRWSTENLATHNLNSRDLALTTFGGGARVCLGQHFFRPEFMLAVRRYFEHFCIEPVQDNFRAHLTGTFGLKSAVGLPVVIKNRDSSALTA